MVATSMPRNCDKPLPKKPVCQFHLVLSINKTVSKIGTNEAKPNGQINIDKGTEKIFLAPLSITKIPMLGKVTFHTLRGMGIAKIKYPARNAGAIDGTRTW